MADELTKREMNYRFSEAELTELAPYGDKRRHTAGEVLMNEGDRDSDVLVLLSGRLDVFIAEPDGERRVGWLEPGQFTGDVAMMTGQRSLITARMIETGDVLHVSPERLQRLLVERSEISDAFVRAFVARRAWAQSAGRASVVLIGRAFDRDAFAIRDLLTKHGVPFLWADVETDDRAAPLLEGLNIALDDTPVLVTGARGRFIKPTPAEVASALGLDLLPESGCADVVVVGAGPAGLAASVYAASEGLSVVTLDATAPGGQAATSSKIENYLGFPTGLSGRELADRASVQAQKFGARIAAPVTAAGLERDGESYRLKLEDGRELKARAIVVASGADYRDLPLDGVQTYRGRGVYYGATAMEAQLCAGSAVVVVGAGNSAGQGAVYLSRHAESVHVLYRRADIRETMSEYLVRRLEEIENVHLHPRTEISRINGDGERIASVDVKSKGVAAGKLDAPFVFLFIGAQPCTEWLPQTVAIDERGFVKTGPTIANIELVRAGWSLDRMPEAYETSWPRLYAVGDVRSGSVKRVASGVGEGSVVVASIHRALAETGAPTQACS